MEAVSSGEMVPDGNSDDTSHLCKKVKTRLCVDTEATGWMDWSRGRHSDQAENIWWNLSVMGCLAAYGYTRVRKDHAVEKCCIHTRKWFFFSFLHSCSDRIRGALRRLVASGENFLNKTLMWIVVEFWRFQTDSELWFAHSWDVNVKG